MFTPAFYTFVYNHFMEKSFNIRVYGIWLTKENELLLADEFEKGMRFTKYPGGGLEFGEGTIDCLKREFLEEMDQEIKVLGHLYTTDYFQQSAFNEMHQLVSIYYFVEPILPLKFTISNKPFDFEEQEGGQSFRLIPLKDISPENLLFPVDKKVLLMLKERVFSLKS